MRPPTIGAVIAVLVSISLSGCVRRGGRNPDCRWPGESDANGLAPNQRGYADHLRDDVEFAEELAVEYMDARHGPRSGAFESHQAASRARNACLDALIGQIARSHKVSPGEVRQFLGRRSLAIDVAVTLPFVVLYVFFVRMLAGLLRRRYPPEDGWTAALVMIVLASLAVGAAGMMAGQQCSMLVENIRIGNGHLSYVWTIYPGCGISSVFLLSTLYCSGLLQASGFVATSAPSTCPENETVPRPPPHSETPGSSPA